jgi:hypothetical protein
LAHPRRASFFINNRRSFSVHDNRSDLHAVFVPFRHTPEGAIHDNRSDLSSGFVINLHDVCPFRRWRQADCIGSGSYASRVTNFINNIEIKLELTQFSSGVPSAAFEDPSAASGFAVASKEFSSDVLSVAFEDR